MFLPSISPSFEKLLRMVGCGGLIVHQLDPLELKDDEDEALNEAPFPGPTRSRWSASCSLGEGECASIVSSLY